MKGYELFLYYRIGAFCNIKKVLKKALHFESWKYLQTFNKLIQTNHKKIQIVILNTHAKKAENKPIFRPAN